MSTSEIVLSFIALFGGLAFFLYGMNVMSHGLETMAKGKLERSLKKAASNKFLALFVGAGITIAIQSSSALTVMLVGLVNSGLLEFGQTIGVLMGSNIGTTLTAWILSLAGIDGDTLWLQLLKPANFSLFFALIGVLLTMAGKKQSQKNTGNILLGFAILMFGMNLMSDSMKPLTELEGFTSLLTAFKNPLLAVAFGAVFTGIIQSSAASVGILQSLALNGGVTYGMAIPIIMGQNIGTCVTALISSIGVSRNAKKVAVVHLSFNIIGTVVCLALYYGANAIFNFAFNSSEISPFMIAIVHSIFNVVTTFMLLPFTKQLEKLANLIIRDKETDKKQAFLDERIITVPAVAVSECNNRTLEMAAYANTAITTAINLIGNYNEADVAKILECEDHLDYYEDKIGTYIVKISGHGISESDSKKRFRILHTIGDLERLGDHAVNLIKVSKEIKEKNIIFSDSARAELNVLIAAIKEILELTFAAYEKADPILATKVEPLEQVIDGLIATVKARHIDRLQAGKCTIELGFVLSDILNNLERISDHCSNIAVAIIEVDHGEMDTHKYLNRIKYGGNASFSEHFDEFEIKYSL
ncbi:MAG: Na/Pi cotransporter family protein [Clostridia bacterium]|nr:Na/Pi cotransporter family protein [Clostridia bacterium]